LWLVKEGSNDQACELGRAIPCNSVVRLEHVDTKKNLHSHLFKAAISGNQEVSGFGNEEGNGDTGDNWVVGCDAGQTVWSRGKTVTFQHADTRRFLTSSSSAMFNQQNCGGNCPIMSQTEVSAGNKKDSKAKWATGQGVYYPESLKDGDINDEL
jgi:dolichyl-phosphate-mannose--protein O-mannosyl transferase